MRKVTFVLSGLALVALLVGTMASTSDAQRPRETVWAGCDLYGTVVTPATFDQANGNFDELYVNPNGFKDGYALMSDAAPGDPSYNGGRWHKNVIKPDVDPGKYANACSVDDLDPSDFDSTDEYFECPLLPKRGNGR